MILKIITPENIILNSDKIKSITITTESGVITILDNHEPIVSVLKTGEIIIREIDEKGKIKEKIMSLNSGFIEVRPKEFSKDNKFEVVLLTEEVVDISDINIDEVNKAKSRAEKAMQEKVDDMDFARLEGLIDRELNKIKLFNKYRPKK